MSWATPVVKQLSEGRTVKFRPKGNSMQPKVYSGDLVTVSPIREDVVLEVGDVVLCKVKGKYYLHLISAMKDDRFQISNNKGFVNGWISKRSIYGLLVNVEK